MDKSTNRSAYKYKTTKEYRECIRQFVKMNQTNYPPVLSSPDSAEWDEETVDEMSYDEEAMSKLLDSIYEKTKDNALFQNIYTIAAAKMISQDHEIGLVVAFSYDYFSSFHDCLTTFYRAPDKFTEDCSVYVGLIKKME
jgi:hypothetical protein